MTYLQHLKGPSICVEDFCGTNGRGFCVQFWADWDGQQVFFGGDWGDVPPMPTTLKPTVDQVHNWASKYTTIRRNHF